MNQNFPFFSVVVPTYQRRAALTACMGSLAKLDYPRDRLEVIVVHDDRGRATQDSLSVRFCGQLDLNELFQSHAGPAAARNAGARRARGDYLAFTDDDCLVTPDWLRSLASVLNTAPKSACAGQTISFYDRNCYSKSSQMINDFIYQSAGAMKAPFVTSNNLAVPADSFRAVGGFAEVFPHAAGEDREFSARWARFGHEMVHASEAIVYHAQDLDFVGFCRQQFRYGRAASLLRGLLERDGQGRVGLERASFYLELLRYPLRDGLNWQAVQMTALLCVSQVAVASGFLLQAAFEPRVAPALPGVVSK
jgi:GT2 family glycosyltransferase